MSFMYGWRALQKLELVHVQTGTCLYQDIYNVGVNLLLLGCPSA
jgi:hypothetical protein